MSPLSPAIVEITKGTPRFGRLIPGSSSRRLIADLCVDGYLEDLSKLISIAFGTSEDTPEDCLILD